MTAPLAALALSAALAAQDAAAPAGDPFAAAGVEGAFVLLDVSSGGIAVEHEALAARRFVPCSTFKIPNTLVALRTGVVRGADFALRWDGEVRDVAAWNRDHTLATAMRDSVVWFYQEVARRIGREHMRAELARLGYGNGEIGERVDRFWLDGPLRISPREQVEFLRRLRAGDPAIRPADAALVRQLVVLEQRPGFTLRGKTGLGRQDGSAVGWLVGEVERDGRAWIYALLVLAPAERIDHVAATRRPLLEQLLLRHGVRVAP